MMAQGLLAEAEALRKANCTFQGGPTNAFCRNENYCPHKWRARVHSIYRIALTKILPPDKLRPAAEGRRP